MAVTGGQLAPGEIVHCLRPVEVGLKRTVTRTNTGGVMQYELFWITANSAQLSVIEPHSVPVETFPS